MTKMMIVRAGSSKSEGSEELSVIRFVFIMTTMHLSSSHHLIPYIYWNYNPSLFHPYSSDKSHPSNNVPITIILDPTQLHQRQSPAER